MTRLQNRNAEAQRRRGAEAQRRRDAETQRNLSSLGIDRLTDFGDHREAESTKGAAERIGIQASDHVRVKALMQAKTHLLLFSAALRLRVSAFIFSR